MRVLLDRLFSHPKEMKSKITHLPPFEDIYILFHIHFYRSEVASHFGRPSLQASPVE